MTEADLIRENAQLTASNARMREALENCIHPGCDCDACNPARDALAESPAASLAAIQDAARAEERERCLNVLRKMLERGVNQYAMYSMEEAIITIGLNVNANA